MNEFLHDEDVAVLLRVSLKSLRNKIEAGDPLPPRSEPPGMRVRLWPKRQVEEWILQFLSRQYQPESTDDEPIERRRGRPSKLNARFYR
jgi:hypothetical protein